MFFDLYRNRVKIKLFLHKTLINVVRLLLVYFLFYKGIWGLCFNLIFSDFNDCFAWWDCSTYKGILYICITYLNIDNIIMLLYILLADIGLFFFYGNSFDNNFIFFGLK